MKLSDIPLLQKNLAIQSAYKRLQNNDDIKGIMLQVIFDEPRAGDQPLQIFIAADDARYATIHQIVSDTLAVGKAAADEQVAQLSQKLADAVAATESETPVATKAS